MDNNGFIKLGEQPDMLFTTCIPSADDPVILSRPNTLIVYLPRLYNIVRDLVRDDQQRRKAQGDFSAQLEEELKKAVGEELLRDMQTPGNEFDPEAEDENEDNTGTTG